MANGMVAAPLNNHGTMTTRNERTCDELKLDIFVLCALPFSFLLGKSFLLLLLLLLSSCSPFALAHSSHIYLSLAPLCPLPFCLLCGSFICFLWRGLEINLIVRFNLTFTGVVYYSVQENRIFFANDTHIHTQLTIPSFVKQSLVRANVWERVCERHRAVRRDAGEK